MRVECRVGTVEYSLAHVRCCVRAVEYTPARLECRNAYVAAPAQQAVPADAAARPQDRCVFENWKQPERVPDQEWRRS
jgi:hypothetical protein